MFACWNLPQCMIQHIISINGYYEMFGFLKFFLIHWKEMVCFMLHHFVQCILILFKLLTNTSIHIDISEATWHVAIQNF